VLFSYGLLVRCEGRLLRVLVTLRAGPSPVTMEPAMVVPVNPAGCDVFDVDEGLVGTFVKDTGGYAFGLEQPNDPIRPLP
jgi:hypothetical protein